jgi:hypothetical protein
VCLGVGIFVRFRTTRVAKDALNDAGPPSDRAQDQKASGMLVYGLVPYISLLIFKSDSERGCRRQIRVGMEEFPIVSEETEIPEAERLGAPAPTNVDVLAGPYGEKEGADGQVGRGPVDRRGEVELDMLEHVH